MSADVSQQIGPAKASGADIIVLLPQDTAAIVLQALIGTLSAEHATLDEHRETLTALAMFISDNLQEPAGSDVPACRTDRTAALTRWNGGIAAARGAVSAAC